MVSGTLTSSILTQATSDIFSRCAAEIRGISAETILFWSLLVLVVAFHYKSLSTVLVQRLILGVTQVLVVTFYLYVPLLGSYTRTLLLKYKVLKAFLISSLIIAAYCSNCYSDYVYNDVYSIYY